MHYYKDLGNGHLMEIIGGEIPDDAIVSAEPIVFIPPVVPEPEPYVPTAEEVANNQIQMLKSARNAAEAATPFVYDDKDFDYDPLSRERINSAVSGATIAVLTGIPIATEAGEWTLADNTKKMMTVGDWLEFKQAEIARSGACHAKYNAKKAEINEHLASEALTDDEKKDAIRLVVWD